MRVMRDRSAVMVAATLIVAGWAPALDAQGFEWPEEPENLQVLEVSGARLGSIMRAFTTDLGVRCSHCHVEPEGGGGLSAYDFVSDEKPAKDKARLMLRMVEEINGSLLSGLGDLGVEARERVRVTCTTCHRGAPRPVMIEDVLTEAIADEGMDAAEARYRELRERFFGGFTYDFTPAPLVGLANRMAQRGDAEEGLRLLDLGLEFNPEESGLLWPKGQILLREGRRDEALQAMERAAQFAGPQQRAFMERQIAQIRGGGGG